MKILFVTANRIGDAVLSTGLLDHLIGRYPAARFTIAAGPLAAPLFAHVPHLDRLLVLTKQSYERHWLRLYRAVAFTHWDIAVDIRRSALTWLLWTRQRMIAPKSDFATPRVVQLAAHFGIDPPPSPRLFLSRAAEARAAALLPSGPILALAPAANWRGKEWPAARFAELVRRLTASQGPLPHARVAVLADARERPQCDALLETIPSARRIDLAGRTDLLTAAAVLRRATLFVGNDSGLMHIAAAAGVPTLGIFGPSHASHYAPWGPNAAAVTAPIPAETLLRETGTSSLMESLSVDAVEDAARRLLERALCAS